MASEWIRLEAGGKLHGELDPETMTLRIKQRDRWFLYHLAQTAKTGRSVVEWSLIARHGTDLQQATPGA